MKTKHTLITLSITILAIFAFSGCASGGGSAGGTHQMGSGSPRNGIPMADRNMPGR